MIVPHIDDIAKQPFFASEAKSLPVGFLHAVRTALMHLYDNAFLQNHPLAAHLVTDESGDRLTRAQDLRRVLLDCIECLRPQPAAHSDAARAYAVLTYRCVDGLTIDVIEEKLGLSRRQTYREYTKGVEAVARQLWDRLRSEENSVQRAGADGLAVGDSAMSRRALAATELERLGKEARRELISLPEVLEGVRQLLETRFQQRGISLTSTVLGTVSPVVADRTLLRQALLNLLSHAVDTVPSQREVVITAEECDGAVQISVALVPADDGVTGTQTPLPREGVALAVAQALVAAQEGELTFYQTDDTWHATVVLPTAQPPTVLVIDDNESLIDLFRRYLAGHRVVVVGTTSGQQAVRIATQVHAQLIVLDVMMPHQDGWEVLQALRAHPDCAEIPIIVCSVLREHELALSLGASDTITKPVSQTKLLEVMRRWLGRLHPIG